MDYQRYYFQKHRRTVTCTNCTVDATGSHERPLDVQPDAKVRGRYGAETSNSPIPIAELRVGRHKKLVGHKKLSRFGVYSIRFSDGVFELFAIVGASYGCVWWRY